MSSGLLQNSGAQVSNRKPVWDNLYCERFWSGLVTNRNPLSDVLSDLPTLRYYGGRPETLIDGLNTEISPQLSLIRRPGLTALDAATYPQPVSRIFSFQIPGKNLELLVDTTNPTDGSGALYRDNRDGTKTLLFTKPAGSGVIYGLSVGAIFYFNFSNGTGYKYTPENSNGSIWNWTPTAPTTPPSLTVTPSGSSAVTWTQTTMLSTMGLVYDASGTGEIFQLVSANASGTNPTPQYAITSNGQPFWNQTPGASTPDNSITWTNKGPIAAWAPLSQFANATSGGTALQPCIIYDPASDSCYVTAQAGTGLTSAVKPTFSGIQNSVFHDGGVKWFALGSPKVMGLWKPGTSYPGLGTVAGNDSVSGICEPTTPELAGVGGTNPQTIYWQTSSGGTSGTGGTSPFQASTPVGGLTNDGTDLQWLNLGSPTWTSGRSVAAFTTFGAVFTAIIDSNDNFQVCINAGSGTTGASAPTWETAYGAKTTESVTGVQWMCVGSAANSNWAANVKWFLPSGGFTPPTGAGSGTANPYGSAIIVDSNSALEAVVASGLTKSGSHPSWSTSLNGQTTDGTVTWRNVGVATANSLAWQTSYSWAFSYKSRASDDFYSTPDPTTGALPIPPGANPAQPLPAITGSGTGAISTASPVATLTGANAGSVVTLKFPSSVDPGVDTIIIWRSDDGGGTDQLFELTELPNPPAINGKSVTISWSDYLPDAATSVYPGLNNQIEAPQNDENDPPPKGLLPQAYWFDRIWGVVGNQIFFSQGPDIVSASNPNEAFAPDDEFEFLAPVTRLVKTSGPLLCFLTNGLEAIQGGPATTSFSQVVIAPSVGLLSYDALDVFSGEIYFFASSRQFYVLTPGLQLIEGGQAIADKLALYNPASAKVAFQSALNDTAIYVGDGATEWYRINPRQSPFGSVVISPRAVPQTGAGVIQSVETAPGVRQLLVASTNSNTPIYFRDLANFSDGGNSYPAYATVGSIILATSPKFAVTRAIDAIFTNLGDTPEVSVLMNEINTMDGENGAAFQPLTLGQSSPPWLYGDSQILKPASYNPQRFYFSSNENVISRCNFLSVKFNFGTDKVKNETISFSITGKLLSE